MPEFVPAEDIDPSVPPMLVGLEPSIVSLRPGQETVLQIVVRGGTGSYRLPIGLSFDPAKVWIHEILPAPGVEVLSDTVDRASGFIDLEVVVTNAIEGGQAVVALQLQALDSGPVPLVFTSGGAVSAGGGRVPVAASDGALFVNGNGRANEVPE